MKVNVKIRPGWVDELVLEPETEAEAFYLAALQHEFLTKIENAAGRLEQAVFELRVQ